MTSAKNDMDHSVHEGAEKTADADGHDSDIPTQVSP